MPSSILLKALGLNTSPNALGAQDGSLVEASNVIIRRGDVIEPRRGFGLYGEQFGSGSDRAKQLFTYQKRIIKHYNQILSYDDGSGNWTDFAGSYTEQDTGLRIKSVESNGNLYFTTSTGIKEISVASPSGFSASPGVIQQAGGIKAIDLDSRVNIVPGVQSAFMTQDSAVAYRAVWATNDANGNLVQGTPSQRSELYSPLINMLLFDYNQLLGMLDDIGEGATTDANAEGTMIDNNNYISTLGATDNTSAGVLYTNLQALVTKIDTDITYAAPTNAPLIVSTGTVPVISSGNILTITFSTGNPQDFFTSGNNIYITGITDSGTPALAVPSIQKVLSTTSSTITIQLKTGNTAGNCTVSSAEIRSYEYEALVNSSGSPFISLPIPSIPTVNSQLTGLQDWVGAIATRLQSEPTNTINNTLQENIVALYELTTSCTTTIDVGIPSEVTSNHFLQLFRSQISPAQPTQVLSTDVVPSDEMQQVYEAYPTAAQLTAGLMTIVDITLPIFMGADLYTNAQSGQGINQSNDIPPYAKDINIFKGTVFYANTRTRHRMPINLLGIVNMYNDVVAGTVPSITTTDSYLTNTYNFVVGVNQVTKVNLGTSGSTNSLASSGNGSYFLINSAENYTQYYAWYQSGTSVDPAVSGRTGICVYIGSSDTNGTVATKTINTITRYLLDFSTTITYFGKVTNSSTTVSNMASVAGLSAGMSVTGTGIYAGSTISSVGTNSIVLSHTATVSNLNVQLTFGGSGSNVFIFNNASGYTAAASAGTSGFTVTTTTSGQGELISQASYSFTMPAGSTFATSGTSNSFTVDAPFNNGLYYVWFKCASSTDPAISGRRGIQVPILAGDSATTVAGKAVTAINTAYPTVFLASNNTTTLTVESVACGPTTTLSATAMPSSPSVTTVQVGALNVLLSSVVSPAQAVDETARSLVRVMNKNLNETIYAYYLTTSNGVPGQMEFEARVLNTYPFYLTTNNAHTGDSFSPSIAPTGSITATIASPTVITTSTNHGLVNGNYVVIGNSNSEPSIDGIWPITYISPTTFSIPVQVISAGTAGSWVSNNNAQYSTNEVKSNRIYYSKNLQPAAVPVVNYMDVGGVNAAIIRIFPIRDSLFVFKEDGLYRVSSLTPPYTISLFDSSCILLAPDSVDVCNNQIYGWTTQGISCVTEAGVKVVSRSIDIDILTLASVNYTNFRTLTWGVGYESDNSYMVFTNANTTDTLATICYRYSNLTNSWTTFDKTNTCGVINPADDKLYLGAGDVNYIEQERKAFNRLDYADRQYDTNINTGTFSINTGSLIIEDDIILPSITNFTIGDVVVQDQLLSTYEFNALLEKLDSDPNLTYGHYAANLSATPGCDISLALYNPGGSGLAYQLDLESGINTHNYVATVQNYVATAITSYSAAPATSIYVSGGHNLVNGRIITIIGDAVLNGTYQITYIDSTHFSIPLLIQFPAATSATFTTQSEDYRDVQACFNAICSNLNADGGPAFKNYAGLNITTTQEAIITDINVTTRTIVIEPSLPFLVGPITVYNAINSTFTYAPQTLDAPFGIKTFHPQTTGDPVSLKHIREATVIFQDMTFTNASVSFSSDLFPQFIEVPITGQGNGIFGNKSFGSGFFGGTGNSVPFRTIVPRNCQRCRYIQLKFAHTVAREKWSIFGCSFTGEIAQSSRAWR